MGLASVSFAAAEFSWVPTQFIAADPGMLSAKKNSGTGASKWGIWRKDPGPRGVRFSKDSPGELNRLIASKKAPSGWSFNSNEWWLEEHGQEPHSLRGHPLALPLRCLQGLLP